ncbi:MULTISPECIES: cupin domain-containing protein [unclassified Streptomyces]|uniref:cupin domain-containing protein n=1 Tax=unclassified Streptomyces TaxID=2593676 RepID=UPI0020246441|nr:MULTISPECIES: cupin domain-containing protein [unclassified Streptomyces]WSC20592.1 cupin domain-containing protein [Streptomyces sp. NBC_01766]
MTTREGVGTAPIGGDSVPLGNRVHHVRSDELDGYAAISGGTVGSKKLWMGRVENPPLSATDDHHHGESEAGIYVVSGHPVFVYHDGTQEVRIAAEPGDFLLVPPFVPHREENPDPDEPVVVVIARTTQEPIKVSVPELYQLKPAETQ